ncbi:hypothetical protein AVEN_130378-1 [Araneus ventricosus]|uniref:Uncharacterized protein n=1 Tax=Araneus ventricosus TaxID=182803 RepID=A0A4Y2BEU4_ARAVE|nr:hypothetical protein AVEN_130378-1 [Araneus ventricosus]
MLFTSTITIIMASDTLMKPTYSFFIDFEKNVFWISVCFIVIQMIHIYQYAFPVFVGIMCGFFYYEFREIFQFRKDLKSKSSSLNRDDIFIEYENVYIAVSTGAPLYQLVQNAVSLPCFFFLCTQLTVMFYSIASFVLTWKEYVSAPHLCEFVMIIIFAPLSVVGTVLCGSRIHTQYQKTQATILLLKDRFI